jgi:hypothetical protein
MGIELLYAIALNAAGVPPHQGRETTMRRFTWLRRPALGIALAFGLGPVLGTQVVHAAGPIATITARYVAATVEVDPAFGEAAGALVCGNGLGGECFNLTPFMGRGLFETTTVIPDAPGDTQSTTLFQGYDVNNDNCVSCLPGDPDPSWESNGNGVIGAAIPTLPGIPLQVFVRALSLHDDGAIRHSLTGTIVVQVFDPASFQQQCPDGSPNCGQPFQGVQACPPAPAPPTAGCVPGPYPYPSAPNGGKG